MAHSVTKIIEASGSCSDLHLGWALHKPRSQSVRFTDKVKQYLNSTSKRQLATRQIPEKPPLGKQVHKVSSAECIGLSR